MDNLVAVHKYGSGNWYAVTDVLRSVRGLSKREGTWAASYRYRIYGALHDSAGAAPFELRYRWTGREFDQETGLYYFRSRYYNPAQFRFIQEDAAGYSGGANLYSYGNGGPTAGRDPDGMSMNYEMQMMPDHPVFQCMGTTEGCTGGMGWSSGEGFSGFLASDLLTGLEKRDLYADYLNGYSQVMRENQDLAPGMRAMDRDEFFRAYDAVMLEVPTTFTLERWSLDLTFRQGKFGVDIGLQGPYATSLNKGTTTGSGRVGLYRVKPENGLAWVNPYVVAPGRPSWYVANVFVHEWAHLVEGRSEGNALWCRVEQLVPNSAGRVVPCR